MDIWKMLLLLTGSTRFQFSDIKVCFSKYAGKETFMAQMKMALTDNFKLL